MLTKAASLLEWNFNLFNWNFILQLHGEINFITEKLDSFPASISLDLHTFFSFFFCKHALNNFFIPLHGKISSQESGIPILQKRDPTMPGESFLHVNAGYNLWIVYNTVGIPAKPNSHLRSCNHHLRFKCIFEKKIHDFSFSKKNECGLQKIFLCLF